MNILKSVAITAALLGATTVVQAQTFSGTGMPASDPTFTGPTQVATFSGANQNFATYSEAGVTFGPGRISDLYANDYNSFGSYLDNNEGNISSLSFAFANPASAFAFNWGAADVSWTVNLFSGATALGSYALTPTSGSNNKEYFGFTGSNITNGTIVASSVGDWVFVDNFTFSSAVAAVPEPATWMMMMLGMAAVGFSMRRKKDTTLRVRFA